MQLPTPFPVPEDRRIRLIISTDAKNEADDQFAIAYALMSPKIEVVGIAAAHFAEKPGVADDSMEQSYREILLVLEKMGLRGKVPVLRGAPSGLADEKTPRDSEAAQCILREAHTPGLPLYVINIGAITDLASAYLLDPTIAQGIAAAIWLGGGVFPKGGSEFNLMNDIVAGNVVMDSTLPLWLIPLNASVPIRLSFSELLVRVKPHGDIGQYLVEQMFECCAREPWPQGESWVLWDMAAVAVLLDVHMYQFHTRNAPRFAADMCYQEVERPHEIRVYDRIEPRYTMEDFYCKLALCFPA